jgi:hypothetical protein
MADNEMAPEMMQEIDEEEALGLAQRLATAKVQTASNRGEMKATRERVLAYMLATDQKEIKLGSVRFTVQEKPEPVKISDLYAQTLRQHYGFDEPDLDQLSDLVNQTKEETAKLRPVLSIRALRTKKSRASNDDADEDGDANRDENIALQEPVRRVTTIPTFSEHELRRPTTAAKYLSGGGGGGGGGSDLYDQSMDATYASDNSLAPNAARDLFMGPLPRVLAELHKSSTSAPTMEF